MVISCGAVPLLSQLIEKVSSLPHAKEQWSKIMFFPFAIPAQSFPSEPTLPILNFMYLTMMPSAPENDTPSPYTVIPSPGAVCPATYRFFEKTMRLLMRIIPATSKTTILFGWLTASLSDPEPLSLRLVT